MTLLWLNSCSQKEQVQSFNDGPSSSDDPRPEQVLTMDQIERQVFIPGELVVKFSDEMVARIESRSADPLSAAAQELGLKRMERLFPHAGEYEPRTRAEGLHTYYVVEFDSEISLSEAQSLLFNCEGVDNVEKRNVIKNTATNDELFNNIWGYLPSNNYNIGVETAWEYTMGDPSVVVCVVDEGIQLNHPDLSWNCGDKHYNFVRNTDKINTPGDHGTHVAGIVAATGNNGVGVAGVAPGDYAKKKRGITLMSAQVFEGNSSARSFENAIKWGADNGAVISQNSWGNNYDFNNDGRLTGQELDYALNDRIASYTADAVNYFIKYAGCDNDGNQLPDSPMKGGIVVFAAGNDGIANGVPASYEPIVAVGAVAKNGRLASYSNYGEWTDICAPGSEIASCVLNNYAYLDGTSMACPYVSGSLALLLSQFAGEGFTNDDLLEILMAGTKADLIDTRGREMGPYLNVGAAMEYGVDKFKRENNHAPVISTTYMGGEFTTLTFRQWENVSIPFTVTDEDGDNLIVETEIEGRGRLVQDENQPEIYNFNLTCELVSDFTPKKAKIIAMDLYDGVAEFEFEYQVLENRPPTAVAGALKNYLLPDAPQSVTVDLLSAFTDPDEEELRYSVRVSPESVAQATIEGTQLKLVKKTNGLATVTVTASDYMGAKAESSFNVLARDASYEIDYYPNPVRDILNIRTAEEKTSDVKVKIASVNGSVAVDKTIQCSAFNPGKVDMTHCAPGQYRLMLETNGKNYEFTIVKL